MIDIALQLFTIGQLGFATNLVVFFFLKNKTKKKKNQFLSLLVISQFFLQLFYLKK